MDAVEKLAAADLWTAEGSDLATQMLALADHIRAILPNGPDECAEWIEDVVTRQWRPADPHRVLP